MSAQLLLYYLLQGPHTLHLLHALTLPVPDKIVKGIAVYNTTQKWSVLYYNSKDKKWYDNMIVITFDF